MSAGKAKLTVLVVGDFPLVRLALGTVLHEHPVFAMCGEMEAGPRVISRCEKLRPHCLVLDLESDERGDVWQLLGDVRRVRPETRVVALSDREDVETLQRAFRAGAHGYVSKRDENAMVPRALDWLCQTAENFVGDRVRERVLGDIAGGRVQMRDTGVEALSKRELEVFRLLGEKNGPTAIARLLRVSVKTVESHQENIKVKLGATGGKDLKRRAAAWLAGGKRGARKLGEMAMAILAGWAMAGEGLIPG